MKVREMIKLLQKCNENDLIMVDIDEHTTELDICDILQGNGTLRGIVFISLKSDIDG
ncbi:hypothetical protein [Cellulosilyticum sp. I15G10I2]|uniref:hypothetical protein n=1 Tax=Cellulosilyticum sp. I15G10I2 TaxID=1892843 RepID=UPI0014957100|nr:hypothetical protein [Cellulosilyticum sp. I15G10I2]